MYNENNETVKKFTASLVDEKYPDIDSGEFFYDLVMSDKSLTVTTSDFEDKVIENDALIFVTEYTRFEVLDINDLKKAISKKKVVRNHEEDDGLIISLISEEQSFIEIFGEEYIKEAFRREFYYYVKGKTKKMKAIDFFNKNLKD